MLGWCWKVGHLEPRCNERTAGNGLRGTASSCGTERVVLVVSRRRGVGGGVVGTAAMVLVSAVWRRDAPWLGLGVTTERGPP